MTAGVYRLWDFTCEPENPVITHYKPETQTSEWTVVIFPGGGYSHRAPHEGKGYAEFLNSHGINAFVVDYRVAPAQFPAPLADARRALRFVRHNAETLGVKKDKVAVMGSSAGGHLAALLSNYREPLAGEPCDELDREDYLPNAQILCYPVIRLAGDFAHVGSGQNLLGDQYDRLAEKLCVDSLVTEQTPPAFVWHTFADDGVPVLNSLAYVGALKAKNVAAELHVFPEGRHGLGLADGDENDPVLRHVAQWSGLLINWIQSL